MLGNLAGREQERLRALRERETRRKVLREPARLKAMWKGIVAEW